MFFQNIIKDSCSAESDVRLLAEIEHMTTAATVSIFALEKFHNLFGVDFEVNDGRISAVVPH